MQYQYLFNDLYRGAHFKITIFDIIINQQYLGTIIKTLLFKLHNSFVYYLPMQYAPVFTKTFCCEEAILQRMRK